MHLSIVANQMQSAGSKNPPTICTVAHAKTLLAMERTSIDKLTQLWAGTIFPVEILQPGKPLCDIELCDGQGNRLSEQLRLTDTFAMAERLRDEVVAPIVPDRLNAAAATNARGTERLEARHQLAPDVVKEFCTRHKIDFSGIIGREPTVAAEAARESVEHRLSLGISAKIRQAALPKEVWMPLAHYKRYVMNKMADDIVRALYTKRSVAYAVTQRRAWAEKARAGQCVEAYDSWKTYASPMPS